LLDRVRDALRTRHYSTRTEESYVGWIRRFILYHGKRHPASLGRDEVNAFLTSLAVDEHVGASTQNQALSALLFLYRVVLEEPFAVDGRTGTSAKARSCARGDDSGGSAGGPGPASRHVSVDCHASVRLGSTAARSVAIASEGRRLRAPADIVRDPKGNRDRATMLPLVVVDVLHKHLERVRRIHDEDLLTGPRAFGCRTL
jgi:hypothetical protein